jgi:hypothetical protein
MIAFESGCTGKNDQGYAVADPRSVICSPSHMIKAVPEVRVIIVISLKDKPGFCTKRPFCILSSPAAMPKD